MGKTTERVNQALGSAWLKVKWAEHHIHNLKRRIRAFEKCEPYQSVSESDPKFGNHIFHKLRLTRPMPDAFALTVDDVAVNLRSALDHATLAVATSHGLPIVIGKYYFPFSRYADMFDNAVNGRCDGFPEDMVSLFRRFQTYKGGDGQILWAMNEICNASKHAMLRPMGVAVAPISREITAFTGSLVFVPTPASWDPVKQEVVVLITPPDTELECEITFEFDIAFDEVEIVGGQETVGVLKKMADVVKGILMAIEAEARRLRMPGF